MGVKVGSARGDERGKARGGTAGDQTGKEVSTQAWYKHSKGWRVFRALNAAAGPKMAQCMQMACDNSKIGYDQGQRNSLYTEAQRYGFDVSKVTKAVETDCSALTRVCAAYAGIMLENYNTTSEPSVLLKSGKFQELTGAKYTDSANYLRAGDILVTKTKGHTVIVLNDGPKAEPSPVIEPPKDYKLGDRQLKNGMEGSDVKELQTLLIECDYSCGKYGADGDFGDATEQAVRAFQKDHSLSIDGICGPKTITALLAAQGEDEVPTSDKVKISGGTCYVRVGAGTSNKAIGTAHSGEVYDYAGKQSPEGWLCIHYQSQEGWVSGKYAKLV